MRTSELLKELSDASGVSGYEADVRSIVHKHLQGLVDELRVDKLGNLIGVKTGQDDGPRHSIMLAAHMDEIGFVVSKMEDGFLHVAQVGGHDPRNLLGQEVTVHGKTSLPGIVGSRPPHVLSPEDRKKTIPLHEMLIDVGLSAEELRESVRVGDVVTFKRGFLQLQDNYVAGKSFDDRAGVASLVCCMQELSSMISRWDVFVVATVQEEVGLQGAVTSAYGIEPDIAIAVDVTFGRAPGLSDEDTVETNKGPAIDVGPNIHPLIYQRLVATAKSHEIPYQIEPIPGASGTDAWAIQVSRQGVPTGLLCIPQRNMHTPVEVLCIQDIERTGRLLAHFIAGLDEDFATSLGIGVSLDF